MTGSWVLVGVLVGGAVGAQGRYAAERVHARWRARRLRSGSVHAVSAAAHGLPWATVVVNVLASALLGAVAGAVAHRGLEPGWATAVGVGVAGGLSTFSTFALDVVLLVRDHRVRAAAGVIAANTLPALAAAALGFALV